MNHKQKLGYTLLGAGIIAVGITIGQFITPNIEAQSNGVFDKITCHEIEVVDEKGKRAIVLQSMKGLPPSDKFFENQIVIYNPSTEREAVALGSNSSYNYIQVMNHQRNKDHQESFGMQIICSREENNLRLLNPQGDRAIELNAGGSHGLAVHDYKEGTKAWGIYSNKYKNLLHRWSRGKDQFTVGEYLETEW
ncbi:hypothetical protein F4X33_04905 [Candidatus Poribacteria bacterium]|nr:hypothetical protein [Candidatus Poribacteria bacterium]